MQGTRDVIVSDRMRIILRDRTGTRAEKGEDRERAARKGGREEGIGQI